MKSKHAIIALLCATLMFVLLPSSVLAAPSDTFYIDEHGTRHDLTATVVEAGMTEFSGADENGGWYVVSENITLSSRVHVSGNVSLILTDGFTLTAIGGIGVNGSNSLTIYGQTLGTGTLSATGSSNGGGIGGGTGAEGIITINGGTIIAQGGDYAAGIGCGELVIDEDYVEVGTLTINGGTITAQGGTHGAGIGGSYTENGGNITINGGNITATGGTMTAGIGAGARTYLVGGSGGNITINGGNIAAYGKDTAAGIGGSEDGPAGNVTITGGTIFAQGGDGSAGIGCGGRYGSGGTITISGGTITAQGGNWGTGIGYACLSNGGCNVIITGGNIKANMYNYGYHGIASDTIKNADGDDLHPTKVKLQDAADGTEVTRILTDTSYGLFGVKTIEDELYLWLPEGAITSYVKTDSADYTGNVITEIDNPTPDLRALVLSDLLVSGSSNYTYPNHTLVLQKGGNYAVSMRVPDSTTEDNIAFDGVSSNPAILTFNGLNIDSLDCAFDMAGANVQLMLVGANTLKSAGNAGIHVPFGATLTIDGLGSLSVESSNTNSAGIGGGAFENGGTINISGGIVFAQGGTGAKDIGSGSGGSGGTLSISGDAAVFIMKDDYITGIGLTVSAAHMHMGPADFAAMSNYGIPLPNATPFDWSGETGIGAFIIPVTLDYDINGGTGTTPPSLIQHIGTTAIVGGSDDFLREHYSFDGWKDDIGTAYTPGDSFVFTANTTLIAQWELVISGLPSTHSMTFGESISWDPKPDGGAWDWDDEFFTASFNSPATFTALKSGSTTITYTVDSITHTITITIQPEPEPQLLTLSLSPADGRIYTDGRVIITPNVTGGSWSFDDEYLSRNGNTFTGLKAGTVRVTYTVGQESAYADIVIRASQLPKTGQDFTLVYIISGAATLTALAAFGLAASRRKRRHAE